MYELGKRFSCPDCGTQCLVIAKSGPGELTCCGKEMKLEKPKKLPSSD